MKNFLLPLFALLISSRVFAQTGSISIVSIPNQIEAGTTVDLQFIYTSDVTADFVVQLFKTNEGSLTVDYGPGSWQTSVTVAAQPAGTNVPITVSFPVPGNVNPSSTLTNRQYTFDLKMTAVGGGDFGYSNGTADHTVEIIPSSVVVDNINFTAPTAANINPGDNLTVDFEYTLTVARNVKAGLAIYTTGGNYVDNAKVGGTEVAQYYANEPATTTTPVHQTATISIPAGLMSSSQLPSGQVYKVVVTIAVANPNWSYVTDKKNDIIVNDLATGIYHNAIASKLTIFPNPAADVVNVSYPGMIKSIDVYNASGSKMNLETILTGSGLSTINISTLETGVYILKVYTNEGVASVKLVK